ncbi:energy transducer TonB family protein [Hyalangium rubrum]|uniref:Energy transducer TonB n=1 Tax=Hyalangium rubrum TaxID=3103134 RepID=A0ABU5H627_9BACT|nr:energy transducer TonB [Hyalangium sp. s54d21]MDY7228706.1 energy transducer TonB [Hyalangium sp. s54d21]
MSPAPPRRLLLALALSLGVHALVWLVLAARARDSAEQRPPPPTPVTLEYVEVEVPPPAAKPPEPPAPPPTPLPPRAPRPTPKPAPPPEATAQAPTPPAPATDVPRTDMPLAADTPRAPGLRLTPSPNLAPPLSLTPGGEVAVAPEDSGGPKGLPSQSAERIVSNLALESLGKGKVERGLVHPYFSQLGKSLLNSWDAERAVSSQGMKGFLEQAQENSKAWNGIWRERAAAYGSSGSPINADAPVQNDRGPPGGDPNLEARRAMKRQMREEFRATRRATIRVVQDAQGKLLEVTLVSPSNNAQVDREALKDVRAAAEQLPPPPAEALAGRQTLTSLWQFELIISITPPVPTLSFEFDEALKFVDMRLPLDRRIYKRVRLLSVQ